MEHSTVTYYTNTSQDPDRTWEGWKLGHSTRKVATLTVKTSAEHAPEAAWVYFQRIDGGPDNPGCRILDLAEAPSMSVGDIVVVDRECNCGLGRDCVWGTSVHAVARFGFRELSVLETACFWLDLDMQAAKV